MIRTVPYVVQDGIPNMTDSELAEVYKRIETEGGRYNIYRGGVDHFIHEVKSGLAILYLTFFGKELVGIGILNDFRGKYAHCHLVIFKNFRGRQYRDITRESVQKALFAHNGEEYIWDGFIAIIPSENRLAIKYAKGCGFTEVGEIPFGYYDWQEKRSEPATMLYLERGEGE